MTERENLIRAYRFQKPERIPIRFNIPQENWRLYRHELENIVLKHTILFPNFKKGSIDYDNQWMNPKNKGGTVFTDPWGCVYEPKEDDVPCYVSKHPLETWDKFSSFLPPDPTMDPINWKEKETRVKELEAKGECFWASLPHGHLFLLLQDIRGYENIILDMCDENQNLLKLIKMIENYSMFFVEKYISLGVNIMCYPEDLGAQDRPMISPAHFRKYIKPSYKQLMLPAKNADVLIHMHSDGYLWDLIDDIIDCGVDIINLQDLVNGIDKIEKNLKNRIAIDLDIDRQQITRFGKPKDIDELIKEEVVKLGSKEGGLSLYFGLYSGASLENVDAIMTAMEKYSFYYS
jgi:hypothetical protein